MEAEEREVEEAETPAEVHTQALERFRRIMSVEEDQRNLAVEDMKFSQTEYGQWDDVGDEEKADEPRFTINKVAGNVAQIVGEQRQNDIAIRVRPTGGAGSKETAEVLNGIIRNIEYTSKADRLYSSAFNECVNGGYGGFYLVTEYDDDNPFQQRVRIKQIKGAASTMFFDENAQEDDKSDSMYAFRIFNMGYENHNAQFPDAAQSDFPAPLLPNGLNQYWFQKEGMMLAHYYRRVPVEKTIALMPDGTVVDKSELREDVVPLIKKERKITVYEVEHYLMNGTEILEGPNQWLGKYIPLIPLLGETVRIEDQDFVRGKVRFAKDAQRMHNFAESAILTTAALSPLDPYWMTEKMGEGHETKLANMNVEQDPVYFYNPDELQPGPPARTGGPVVQEALIQIARSSEANIQATMGVVPGAPHMQSGMNIDPRSGEAIQRAGERGDAGNYVYYDNLSSALECIGTQLVDLIPKVMVGPRLERILGRDGKEDLVWVNKAGPDKDGNTVINNDLTAGSYDVVVDTGPAFATQRIEAVEKLSTLTSNNPMLGEIAMDLIVQNLDVPNSEELFERVRKLMIGKGIVEPTDEERQELGIDEREMMKQQLIPEILTALQNDATVRAVNAQAADMEANARLKNAKATESAANVDKTTSEAAETDMDAVSKANEALAQMLANLQEKAGAGVQITAQDIANIQRQGLLVEKVQTEAFDNS